MYYQTNGRIQFRAEKEKKKGNHSECEIKWMVNMVKTKQIKKIKKTHQSFPLHISLTW